MKSKTYYYKSYSDDFAVTKDLKKDIIGDDYKYESRNIFFKIYSHILYYWFVKPLAYLILKIRFGYKIKNKRALKECKNKGYFIYGNHTNYLPDAFVPNVIRHNRCHIIVGGQTVSIKGLKTTVKALGATPLGDTLKAQKNLFKFMSNSIQKNKSIMIYPEAHIWPYYTSVRPFSKTSLKYPILLNCPTYSLSYCYSKRKIIKRPKLTVYVDGPFYPDTSLNKKEMEEKLYQEIYTSIKDRTDKYSTYSINNYIKK